MTPLNRLEEEADEVIGRGSAVSIDGDHGAITVALWDRSGAQVFRTSPHRTRGPAIVEARAFLRKEVA